MAVRTAEARRLGSDGLLALLLLAAFAPALAGLAAVWSSVDHYSHGFLVPVVSLWLAQRRAPQLASLPVRRDGRGGAALGAALAAYALGLGLGSVPLQGLALVGAVAAFVAWRRGPAWLRALRFPLFFLLFMVPLPETWLAPRIVALQLFVSRAAIGLLHAFGQPVAREGNVIVLPGESPLFVAEACSGITSIVTLVPLALLLGVLTLDRVAPRGLLLAAVVPAAMLGNLLRVVVTVWAALRVGVETATGSLLHEFAGLITFGVSCGLLIGLGALLQRARPEPGAL